MDFFTFGLIIILVIVVTINLVTFWWVGWMLYPYFHRGGPYVPTPDKKVERMIKLSRIQPKDIVVDMGSGDGKLVIAAAKAGAKHTIGYEINPRLIKLSRKKSWQAGTSKKTEFKRESMWKADLSNVDIVFIYQLPGTMKRLQGKMLAELKSGAKIVSNAFVMPDWQPKEEAGGIYLYEKK